MRTQQPNKMFHCIIREIARQASHLGAKWDEESWKRFLVDQWAADTKHDRGQLVQSLDGERIVQLGRQTRKFSVEEASEFTDWLIYWCAENGIKYDVPETPIRPQSQTLRKGVKPQLSGVRVW